MITQQFFTIHLNVYWNKNDVSISKHCRNNIRCPLFKPKDTMQYFIRRNIQTLIKTFVYPEKKLLVRKLETKYTTSRPLTQNGQTNSLPPNLFCWKPIEITIKYNIIPDVNWTEWNSKNQNARLSIRICISIVNESYKTLMRCKGINSWDHR